jgi:hypothetical protein
LVGLSRPAEADGGAWVVLGDGDVDIVASSCMSM